MYVCSVTICQEVISLYMCVVLLYVKRSFHCVWLFSVKCYYVKRSFHCV